jgi:hypothetical protein
LPSQVLLPRFTVRRPRHPLHLLIIGIIESRSSSKKSKIYGVAYINKKNASVHGTAPALAF